MTSKLESMYYPVVDAFQMQLTIDADAGTVRGTAKKTLQVLGGFDWKFKLSACAYFYSYTKKSCGVLLRGPGDLYVMSAYNELHDMLSVFLIDRKKVLLYENAHENEQSHEEMKDLIPLNATIKEAADMIKDGIKKSFCRRSKETKWVEFEYGKE